MTRSLNTNEQWHGKCTEIVSEQDEFILGRIFIYSISHPDTDTDYSESEALSSLPMSGPPKGSAMSPPSQSDSEHHQVLRIETKTAPKPSQVEVVLSDGES